jgi:metallo-beta-lactamase family protein
MTLHVTSYGAARTVTGSCHLVEIGGKRFLMDCGLFQGSRALEDLNTQPWGFKLAQLDALILSHAHLDHAGRLPKLVKDGFDKPIYATSSTRQIVEHLLLDSAKLQKEDYQRDLRKGRKAEAPMYDEDDIAATLRLFREITYREPVDLGGVRLTAQVAGHIPGSASLLLEAAGERFVFSGDLGNARKDILPDPTPCEDADLVLMESTYGDRDHKPFEQTLKEFAGILQTAADHGGKILIPSFALERTQDLLYHVARMEEEGLIPKLPVFVDSPLASKIEETYSSAKFEFEPHVQRYYSGNRDPFQPARLKYTKTVDDSKALNDLKGAALIIAGGGMMTGGRILHHLRNNLAKPSTSLVIVGFQPEGGLGRRLIDGAPTVRILGDEIPVRARVFTVNGFSAHADRTELLEWSAAVRGEVRLVHGEVKAMESLKAALIARGQRSSLQVPAIKMPEGGGRTDGE